MPQEPKKRHSRQRKGKRRAAIKLKETKGVFCKNCQTLTAPYSVCKKCGYYKGKQILAVKQKAKKEKQA
ncbi:MAG: 50S ribosomal protein L32 [Candidatus Levybacteria bacterium]|nr:50S ribosomal protein L32 [Candidatus Levybacteria bacterium]